ncbi:hypothetical protein LCGC14_2651110 [marine sediment metagenome]|uniref:Uncharacterized protein n=1 Tax=marine sediment metagenome TaxID=412755 RepID=A0A0F9AH28_9ZZZZ
MLTGKCFRVLFLARLRSTFPLFLERIAILVRAVTREGHGTDAGGVVEPMAS